LSKDLVVKRKLLKVERVIGETTVREAVEAEIALPFKIEKVFEVITNVTDIETEVRTGGVLVTGVIDKQLFVVDKGDLVHHVPEEIQFRAFVDVDGAQPEMNVQVQVRVLTVDTHLINAETVKQTVVLEIFVKVTVTEQIEVVIDVQGRGISVKKELLKVESVVGILTKNNLFIRHIHNPPYLITIKQHLCHSRGTNTAGFRVELENSFYKC
jgi:hypothetical protein